MSYSPYTFAGRERDDEEERCGRVLTKEEYAECLNNRTDMFLVDRNTLLKRCETACLSVAISVGWLLPGMKLEIISPDMFFSSRFAESPRRESSIKLSEKQIDVRERYAVRAVLIPRRISACQRNSTAEAGPHRARPGGGDPHARSMKQGLLALVSSVESGKDLYSDPLFLSGYAKNIDAILSGNQSLKPGSSAGVGRRDGAVIGFGLGADGDFGDKNRGCGGDASGGFFVPAARYEPLTLKRNPSIALTSTRITTNSCAITNGRNRGSIMRGVQQNLNALRYAYNQLLHEKPGLQGNISVRFAIDEFGRVLLCDVLESTMHDSQFELVVVAIIKRRVFEKIDKPGDVTEVPYPFVFSM